MTPTAHHNAAGCRGLLIGLALMAFALLLALAGVALWRWLT